MQRLVASDKKITYSALKTPDLFQIKHPAENLPQDVENQPGSLTHLTESNTSEILHDVLGNTNEDKNMQIVENESLANLLNDAHSSNTASATTTSTNNNHNNNNNNSNGDDDNDDNNNNNNNSSNSKKGKTKTGSGNHQKKKLKRW